MHRERSCLGSPITGGADRGFTLIELLIVIAIIAVLISILLPSLYMARCEADSVKCLANLRPVMQATHLYLENQGGSTQLGWHRKWSTWNVVFFDGHAGGYFDTRQIYGLGGTIWQPRLKAIQGGGG